MRTAQILLPLDRRRIPSSGTQWMAESLRRVPSAAICRRFRHLMKSLSDGIFPIALAHLTITVSIGTMLLWFYIIRLIGASQASAFHFLVPIFGIIQSAIILNDRITTRDVLGIFVVSVSLMLVNGSSTNRSKKYHWVGEQPGVLSRPGLTFKFQT